MGWNKKVENLLGACTRTGAFGDDTMTHQPAGGTAQTFNGIWSNQYLEADPETGMTIMSDDPNVGARVSDFNFEPVKGDTITYKGQSYTVRSPEKDGEGGITLVLEKVINR